MRIELEQYWMGIGLPESLEDVLVLLLKNADRSWKVLGRLR